MRKQEEANFKYQMTKRINKKGEGSLFNKNGYWYVRWMVNGKVYAKSTGTKSYREAQKRKKEIVAPFASRREEEAIRAFQRKLEGISRRRYSFDEAWTEFSECRHLASERDETLQKGRWRKFVAWMSENHPAVTRIDGVDKTHAMGFLKSLEDSVEPKTYNEYNLLKQAGIELNDENTFKFKDSDYNIQEDGVYMKRDNYLQHQKEAEAFAQASRKGWEWSKAHKEEALEIVMQYVAKENIATNRVIQRLMLEEVIHLQLDQKTGEQPFTLRRDMVESAVNILHENGLIQHEIDYEELIP